MDIKNEPKTAGDRTIRELSYGLEKQVREFQMPKLNGPGDGDYRVLKAKYGSLATTDSDRSGLMDPKFHLNQLVRDPLLIEEEERRAIEERVRARLSELAEEEKKTAGTQGFQAGLEKGRQEALKIFRSEASERLESFDAFLDHCENAKAEIFKANERFLTEMVFRIARMVLLKEVTTDREYVSRLAKSIVDQIGVRENIRIRISEGDFATAQQIKENLETALGALKNLSIEASSQVGAGGCLIDTQWNSVDATLEAQLKGLHEALVGKNS